jgi:hypothetical protein
VADLVADPPPPLGSHEQPGRLTVSEGAPDDDPGRYRARYGGEDPQEAGSKMAAAGPDDFIQDRFPSRFVGQSLTLAEFQRRRIHLLNPYHELIDRVVCQRDAFWMHLSVIRMHLLTVLEGFDGKRRHGIALPSLDCIVGELFLVPAGSYFRNSTLWSRGITSFREDDWGLPDIVFEVVPLRMCGYTMPEKCRRYLDIGIPVVMLVDTDDESVQILRPNQSAVTVHGDRQIDLSDVIPGLDLTSTALFHEAIPQWHHARRVQAEDEAAAPERSDG